MFQDLIKALEDAGFRVQSVGLIDHVHPTQTPASFFPRPDGQFLRIDWEGAVPSAAEVERAKNVIETFVPPKTRAQRIGELRQKRRAGQPLTPMEQTELMDLLLGI